jgi:outer membrane protein assembly factor BamA
VSARAGHADAFGSSQDKGVPEYERFYAGGSSTIRGYDEREFGPGDFMLLANLEVRFPIVWNVVGVAFMDMGNVWASIDDVERYDFDIYLSPEDYTLRRATDVKYTVGAGIGYQTPVGPARIDYGMRLKRGFMDSGEKEPAGMFHITWGHVF